MVYSKKLRNMERRQTRSATSLKRCLRKPRSSVRYTDLEEDLHLQPLEEPSYLPDKDVDAEVSQSFSKTSNKSYNDKLKQAKDSSSLVSSTNDMSGRLSVVSCESYDSGVGSKSDDDLVCLPHTPEKVAGKAFTIELNSPDSRGVLELIDTGGDCYVGYFKPVNLPEPNTPVKADDSCSKCSLTRRPGRIRRSVSTNISDDSCDSAFQSQRYPNRRDKDNDDSVKAVTSIISELKINKSKSVKLDKSTKTNTFAVKRNSSPIKQSGHNIKRIRVSPALHTSFTPQKQSMSDSDSEVKLGKRSPSARKTALRRIQHHNRSPERSPDAKSQGAAGKHCRTRSHVKSLLKDIFINPVTNNNTSTPRPKPSPNHHISKRSSLGTKPTYFGPNSFGVGQRAGSIGRSVRTSLLLKNGRAPADCANGDDVVPAKQHNSMSACHWRFCKAEVAAADLVDHIERLHVASQRRNSRAYKCFWEGCKVYGKVAKSIIWLEGHVKKHLGPRPYHCIFPNCAASFSTQEVLQKHVDTHIDESQSQLKPVKKVDTVTIKKTEKKCIKRLRGTEKCIPKRTDFFTSNVLEAAKWENKMLNEKWYDYLTEDLDCLRVRGQVVAMTTQDIGSVCKESLQLHWFPEQLCLPDSWHDREDPIGSTRQKKVKLSSLPRNILLDLYHH